MRTFSPYELEDMQETLVALPAEMGLLAKERVQFFDALVANGIPGTKAVQMALKAKIDLDDYGFADKQTAYEFVSKITSITAKSLIEAGFPDDAVWEHLTSIEINLVL